jgi:ribosome-binding factor A
MSHRIEKIESTLSRAIQQVISQGLHDPRASGLISVTRVDVSPDMASAMVFISIYPEDRQTLSMHALRAAARHIRHEAAELMAIRKMPQLDFRLDKSLKQQAAAYAAIAKARPFDPASPEAESPPADPQANTSPPADEPHPPETGKEQAE